MPMEVNTNVKASNPAVTLDNLLWVNNPSKESTKKSIANKIGNTVTKYKALPMLPPLFATRANDFMIALLNAFTYNFTLSIRDTPLKSFYLLEFVQPKVYFFNM
jgi:hypothetical protein